MRSLATSVIVLLLLMYAAPSFAQRVQARPLKWNPYRDMGGSCVYGKKGEVLFQPEGVICKEHKPGVMPGSAVANHPRVTLPPELRLETEALLTDHDHIAIELAQLRTAIATKRKKKALDSADRVIKHLTEHLAREAEFFRKIAPAND